nr:RNA polymerase subunit sigma-70 [Mycobacterium celatum]
MLGSVHDAEDLVQETYLRGWRAYEQFEERAALRTWLYRIATTACLRALENRARRVLPTGVGTGSVDPDADFTGNGSDYRWIEPLPDALTPETAVTGKQSIRLAIVTAMQELPARQRAVLILRGDVVQFNAADVAELLETTPVSVNSALQRARARLAEVDPGEDDVAELDDAALRELVDRYCAAFEKADIAALTELLQADVKLERRRRSAGSLDTCPRRCGQRDPRDRRLSRSGAVCGVRSACDALGSSPRRAARASNVY